MKVDLSPGEIRELLDQTLYVAALPPKRAQDRRSAFNKLRVALKGSGG